MKRALQKGVVRLSKLLRGQIKYGLSMEHLGKDRFIGNTMSVGDWGQGTDRNEFMF